MEIGADRPNLRQGVAKLPRGGKGLLASTHHHRRHTIVFPVYSSRNQRLGGARKAAITIAANLCYQSLS